MNPERYNKDGTYKKKSRGRWKLSKAYMKKRSELRELFRKEAASRKYAGRELANRLRAQGDVLVTEPKNAGKLAKRAKTKTQRQEKESVITKKDGTKAVVHKCKRKKRFGRSIGRASPAAFQDALEKGFGKGYHTVPGMTYRASQYDPFLNEYIKKKLSERWHTIPDGRKVQRDLMSAFLLYCADKTFEKIDRKRCLALFEDFWKNHQKCTNEIVEKHLSIHNSGIKTKES